MDWTPDRYAKLRARLRRSSVTDEVAEELRHHFDALVDRYVNEGMSEDEARDAALSRFGDLDRIRRQTTRVDEQIRRRGAATEYAHDAARGVRLAARRLVRRPDFTVFATLTLTLALGACSALFTVLDRLVLSPLPYPDADALVWIDSRVPGVGPEAAWGVSDAGYFDFQSNTPALAGIGAFSSSTSNFNSTAGPVRVETVAATASLGPTLGLSALHGRWLGTDEDVPGGAAVAVLGHRFWLDHFGGDPAVVGSVVDLNAVSYEVVGILRDGLELPDKRIDVWTPLRLNPAARPVNQHWLSVIGRLAQGTTIEEARTQLDLRTSDFVERFPTAYTPGFMRESGFFTRVVSVKDRVLGSVGRTIWVLFAASGLLLLIALANITNLYLVRTEGRRRDFAVRAALGARKRHLAWQCLSETLILCGVAGALAIGVAQIGIRVLVATAPPALPRLPELALSGGTITFTLAIAVGLSVFLGLVPLAYQSFGRSGDLVRDGGLRMTASNRQNRARRLMLAGQMALAIVLLAAGGLMLRSLQQLRSTDPGFAPDQVLMLEVFLPWSEYGSYEEVVGFYRSFLDRIEAVPGVVRAGATTRLPMVDVGGCAAIFVDIPPLGPDEAPPCVPVVLASPGFFETLGIEIEGAPPSWASMDARDGSILVTRALADRLWRGESPIERGVRGNGATPPYYRVRGIAANYRSDGLDQPPLEAVFYPLYPIEGAPLWQPPNRMRIVVKTTVEPTSIVAAVRDGLRDLDPTIPAASFRSMATVVATSPSMSRASFSLVLLGIAAALALLLSTLGMYGVVAQVVVERSGEIAVRLALGARVVQVVQMLLGQSLRVALVGAVVGLAGTVALGRVMGSMLFGVTPTDPLTLIGTTMLLLLTVAAATLLASRRARRVDPIRTLRAE